MLSALIVHPVILTALEKRTTKPEITMDATITTVDATWGLMVCASPALAIMVQHPRERASFVQQVSTVPIVPQHPKATTLTTIVSHIGGIVPLAWEAVGVVASVSTQPLKQARK
eukprot:m.148223 g.148223  ORF g.148223 m.148223 type:complete len:114 (-) comp14171_c0_seq1:246-587(-)